MKKILSAILIVLTVCTICDAKKRKPVIGIAAGISGTSSSVGADYVESVRKAGGIPIIIPLMTDEATTEAAISLVDGVLMIGGADIDPSYFGENVLNETVYVDSLRDRSDLLIISAAMKKGLPMLGICRGEQIINVVKGGTLYQDLPAQKPSEVKHRQSAQKNQGTHLVRIEKGSRLCKLLQTDSIMVNSTHHQAVKDIASCFTVTARAEDGVIEAYEGENILCVQFHPEGFVGAGNDSFLPIFQDLVKKASRKG